MTVSEVSFGEYSERMERHPHIYNSVGFAQLNAYKSDGVRCLLFDDNGRVRFGMILGQRGDRLLSPFSAPFGGFSANRRQSLEKIDEAVSALSEYAKSERKDIRIVLPPQFYDSDLTASCINVLSRRARMEYIDLNYYF